MFCAAELHSRHSTACAMSARQRSYAARTKSTGTAHRTQCRGFRRTHPSPPGRSLLAVSRLNCAPLYLSESITKTLLSPISTEHSQHCPCALASTRVITQIQLRPTLAAAKQQVENSRAHAHSNTSFYEQFIIAHNIHSTGTTSSSYSAWLQQWSARSPFMRRRRRQYVMSQSQVERECVNSTLH